ncbi:hypothetical protein PtB15_10B266 [Puccinia triticina]|nr:hypothetical protein PtB15_10B266 [Puccinia triticina]
MSSYRAAKEGFGGCSGGDIVAILANLLVRVREPLTEAAASTDGQSSFQLTHLLHRALPAHLASSRRSALESVTLVMPLLAITTVLGHRLWPATDVLGLCVLMAWGRRGGAREEAALAPLGMAKRRSSPARQAGTVTEQAPLLDPAATPGFSPPSASTSPSSPSIASSSSCSQPSPSSPSTSPSSPARRPIDRLGVLIATGLPPFLFSNYHYPFFGRLIPACCEI